MVLGGVGVGGRGRAEKGELVAVVKKKEPAHFFFIFSPRTQPHGRRRRCRRPPPACLPAWRTCSTDVLDCMCLHFLPPASFAGFGGVEPGDGVGAAAKGCLLLVAPVFAAAPSRLVAGTGTPWAARRRVAGP